ncbi:MAG: FixH family protein [Pseudonocardiaceae bacterium]
MICAVLGLLAGAGSASAHAVLISTDPGQGAVVATVPATVSLTFGEPVVAAADGIRVFGPDGAEVDDGRTTHLGRSEILGVGLRRGNHQPQGTYTVSWRVISADSHPVAGAFTFSVGHPSPSRAPAAAQPSGSTTVGAVYAIVRAAAFAAYALLVGSIAFVLLCWPGAIARRDVRRVVVVGWAGLLATTMATLLLQGSYGNGLGIDRLFDSAIISETLDSRLGTALTARLLLLGLAGGYLVLLCGWLSHVGRRGRGWFGALGVAMALGLAATWAAADHAAVGVQPALALPVDIVHLLAMGVWIGGLATIVVVLRPADTTPAAPPPRAMPRFSSIATGSIATLIATGSYQSWRQLGSWSAFGSTDYGRLLLIKLTVFAVLLAVALRSHRAAREWRTAPLHSTGLHSTPLTSTLRSSVLAEAALGAVVLGVTAMLVNAEPGRTATAAQSGSAHQVLRYDTGGPNGRGQLVIDVDPAAAGPNSVRITVEDPRGAPREVAELHSTMTLTTRQLGPFVMALQHTAPGGYVANGIQLPYRGTWQLRVTVRSSDIDETTVATPIDIR